MNKTYYDITKEYPDMYRVMIYKTPFTPKPQQKNMDNMSELSKSIKESSSDRSVRRTRRILHDLVNCNDFTIFCTFTFDPKKVNRYDILVTYQKMHIWLTNQQRKDRNLKYLVVPEKHKDGAIHFHALISNYPFALKKTNVIADSRRVYNVPAFRWGFTAVTFLPTDDTDAKSKAGNYIAKYISKDMALVHNRHRYFASRNLSRPTVHYNSVYELGLNTHLNHKSELMETEFNTIYEVPKDLLDK